jgi:hypothetical protein
MALKTKSKATQGMIRQSLRPGAAKSRKLTTTITFSANDLAALADYLAAGMLLLRITTPHRVIAKLKAAMSRLTVPIPRGL